MSTNTMITVSLATEFLPVPTYLREYGECRDLSTYSPRTILVNRLSPHPNSLVADSLACAELYHAYANASTQPQASIEPQRPVAPMQATVNSSNADSTIMSDSNVAGKHIQWQPDPTAEAAETAAAWVQGTRNMEQA